MTAAERVANVIGVLIPAAALVLATVLLWDDLVGPEILAFTLFMYVVTGLAISVGFHRMLSHRAFDAARPTRAVLTVIGSMSFQGPVLHWVANHRKHHAFTDEEGDPHSPHLTNRRGFTGALAGLWHAHMGWFITGERAELDRYVPDLQADPMMRFLSRTHLVWVLLGLAIAAMFGLAVGGTLEAALLALLWGGAVRIFMLQHMTFAVNSLCHFIGRKRFVTDDEGRNFALLAPLTFGEAWHNNHHAFPTSAYHGLRRREFDPGGMMVSALERLGLIWNVNRPTIEGQQAKARAPLPPAGEVAAR